VASLWAVNDRSTMQLMGSFYKQLLADASVGRGFSLAMVDVGQGFSPADKATALAEAQRDLIGRGGRYSHPYFWGAFVLVGQMK
jgi:CHAT domain-containing protein